MCDPAQVVLDGYLPGGAEGTLAVMPLVVRLQAQVHGAAERHRLGRLAHHAIDVALAKQRRALVVEHEAARRPVRHHDHRGTPAPSALYRLGGRAELIRAAPPWRETHATTHRSGPVPEPPRSRAPQPTRGGHKPARIPLPPFSELGEAHVFELARSNIPFPGYLWLRREGILVSHQPVQGHARTGRARLRAQTPLRRIRCSPGAAAARGARRVARLPAFDQVASC